MVKMYQNGAFASKTGCGSSAKLSEMNQFGRPRTHLPFLPRLTTMSERSSLFLLLLAPLSLIASPARADDLATFSRDVLPLLSDRCFHCHGPDESNREAGLRLDRQHEATASGAIVPGKPDQIWHSQGGQVDRYELMEIDAG